MRRRTTFKALILLSTCAAIACAQERGGSSAEVGTIYGEPLVVLPVSPVVASATFAVRSGRAPGLADGDAVEGILLSSQCAQIGSAVVEAVVKNEVRALRIQVGPTEVEREWARLVDGGLDPVASAEKQQQVNASIFAGLSRVYDHGDDPESIFTTTLAGLGVPNSIWQMYLVEGRSPELRAALTPIGQVSASSVIAAAKDGLFRVLETRKLAYQVDDRIAASDVVFGLHLSEMRMSQREHSDGLSFNVHAAAYNYLQSRRAAWWRARVTESHLALTGPAAAGCDLQDLGANIAMRVR